MPAVTSKTGARRVTGTRKHSSQKGWDASPHFLDLLQVVGHLIDLAFAVVDAPVQRFLQQTDTHIAKRRVMRARDLICNFDILSVCSRPPGSVFSDFQQRAAAARLCSQTSLFSWHCTL